MTSGARPIESLRVVLCTVPERDAMRLAWAVVEEGLVACVNIVPDVTSVYRWEGQVHQDRESLLIMKTTAEAMEGLTGLIKRLHSYTVPEVIGLPLDPERGNPDYLAWLVASVLRPRGAEAGAEGGLEGGEGESGG